MTILGTVYIIDPTQIDLLIYNLSNGELSPLFNGIAKTVLLYESTDLYSLLSYKLFSS